MSGTSVSCSGNTCTIFSEADTIAKIRQIIFSKLNIANHEGINKFNFEIQAESKDSDILLDPRLTLFQQRCATYLSICPEFPIYDLSDTSKVPELQPDKLGKEIEIPSIEQFTHEPMTIDLPIAIFLLEIFGTNQSKAEKCSINKEFMKSKKLYRLCLLPEYPVCIESIGGNKAKLTFADTNIADAKTIKNQVAFALNVFSSVRVVSAQIINVDESLNLDSIQKLSDEINMALIRSDVQESDSKFSFVIYGVPSLPGRKYRKIFEDKVRTLFESNQLWECTNCHKIIRNSTRNVECVTVDEANNNEEIVFLNGHSKSKHSISSIIFNA